MQNLHVYGKDGALIFDGEINDYSTNEWQQNFPFHELALDGRGGAIQTIAFGLDGYWPQADTSQKWSRWRSDLYHTKNDVPHNTPSDPAVNNNTQRAYVATQMGTLDIYNAYCQPNWFEKYLYQVVIATTDLSQGAPTIVEIDTPAAKAGTVFLGGANGFVYAVDPGDDRVRPKVIFKWDLADSPLDNRMVIDKNNAIIYVTSIKDGFLYAIDLYNVTFLKYPNILWRAERVTSLPALLPDGTVVVGSKDGEIIAYEGGAAFR